MTYLIFSALLFMPLIIFFILALKLQMDIRLSTCYLLEAIIVGILTLIGHFYYYMAYGLHIFPMHGYMKFFLGTSFGIIIIMVIIDLFSRAVKKEPMLPFKGYILIYVCFAVLFLWLIPLGQKYYYADRLDKMNTIFENEPAGKVAKEDRIKIGLVASEYDKFMRPRYRSPGAYNNYVYMRNNDSSPFFGHIYLTIKNERNHPIDVKLIENIEVPANSTELIVVPGENKLMAGKWDQRSFKSKQQVDAIEAVVVAE